MKKDIKEREIRMRVSDKLYKTLVEKAEAKGLTVIAYSRMLIIENL